MAEEEQTIQIPRVKLGTQGLEVSKLGFGCMGLSGGYNDPLPDDVGISIIKHEFDRGITFFDTSDIYGPKTNEILVGKALKQLPREKVQLARKFGIESLDSTGTIKANGTPEFVRASVEASLKRPDVEYIDLYYQHRVDPETPIEDTWVDRPLSGPNQNRGQDSVLLIFLKPGPEPDLNLPLSVIEPNLNWN
ncbi:hypothetical protein PTKIN_Ptkin06aG0190300 [Pterospermum kingtungense]